MLTSLLLEETNIITEGGEDCQAAYQLGAPAPFPAPIISVVAKPGHPLKISLPLRISFEADADIISVHVTNMSEGSWRPWSTY